MIKMSEKDLEEFEQTWSEIRDCYFRIKQKRAKIVTVRDRAGREYRCTVPLLKREAVWKEDPGCRR